MTLQQMIDRLDLTLLTEQKDFSKMTPTAGYASDLLSCVMASAEKGGIWITLQSHINIVAVAALLGLSAIVITEGTVPDQEVIDRANEVGVTLLSTEMPTFYVVGMMWEMGLRDS